jgi:hypothetical protein
MWSGQTIPRRKISPVYRHLIKKCVHTHTFKASLSGNGSLNKSPAAMCASVCVASLFSHTSPRPHPHTHAPRRYHKRQHHHTFALSAYRALFCLSGLRFISVRLSWCWNDNSDFAQVPPTDGQVEEYSAHTCRLPAQYPHAFITNTHNIPTQ